MHLSRLSEEIILWCSWEFKYIELDDAYATGSGFLDSQSVNGITVIPLEDNLDNKMVYVKREEMDLSPVAEKFVEVMVEYFDQKR